VTQAVFFGHFMLTGRNDLEIAERIEVILVRMSENVG